MSIIRDRYCKDVYVGKIVVPAGYRAVVSSVKTSGTSLARNNSFTNNVGCKSLNCLTRLYTVLFYIKQADRIQSDEPMAKVKENGRSGSETKKTDEKLYVC